MGQNPKDRLDKETPAENDDDFFSLFTFTVEAMAVFVALGLLVYAFSSLSLLWPALGLLLSLFLLFKR